MGVGSSLKPTAKARSARIREPGPLRDEGIPLPRSRHGTALPPVRTAVAALSHIDSLNPADGGLVETG